MWLLQPLTRRLGMTLGLDLLLGAKFWRVGQFFARHLQQGAFFGGYVTLRRRDSLPPSQPSTRIYAGVGAGAGWLGLWVARMSTMDRAV